MQTRDEGGGKGVHHPHWRENKNASILFGTAFVHSFTPHAGGIARFR
jgi:hypothetical protein